MTPLVGTAGRLRSSVFVREASVTLLVRLLGGATTFLVAIVAARALGVEGRGAYAVAFSIATVGIQLSCLGMHTANTYFVARDRSRAGALLSNTLLLSAASAIIVGCVMLGARVEIARTLSIDPPVLLAAAACIPLGLCLLLCQHLLLGLNDINGYNLGEALSKGLMLGAIVALALTGQSGVLRFLIAGAGATVFAMVALLGALRRRGVRVKAPSSRLMAASIAYALRVYMVALFSYVLLRADLLLVGHYRGATEAGYYSVAVALGDALLVLPIVFSTVAFPRLAGAISPEARRGQTLRLARAVLLAMLVTTAAAALVSGPVIRSLFGTSFEPSVVPFLWLAPGIVCLGMNIVFMNYFAAGGMPWTTVAVPGFVAALNMVANVSVIPRWGILGASLTSTICYALILLFSVGYLLHPATGRDAP